MHPPEDQIIHLELPASHEPLVVAPERISVAYIFYSSLPSSLVDQIDSDFQGKDGLGPIHHEERRLSSGSTG
jgi:hypothetical protein